MSGLIGKFMGGVGEGMAKVGQLNMEAQLSQMRDQRLAEYERQDRSERLAAEQQQTQMREAGANARSREDIASRERMKSAELGGEKERSQLSASVTMRGQDFNKEIHDNSLNQSGPLVKAQTDYETARAQGAQTENDAKARGYALLGQAHDPSLSPEQQLIKFKQASQLLGIGGSNPGHKWVSAQGINANGERSYGALNNENGEWQENVAKNSLSTTGKSKNLLLTPEESANAPWIGRKSGTD